jgi:hypothetical protein
MGAETMSAPRLKTLNPGRVEWHVGASVSLCTLHVDGTKTRLSVMEWTEGSGAQSWYWILRGDQPLRTMHRIRRFRTVALAQAAAVDEWVTQYEIRKASQ